MDAINSPAAIPLLAAGPLAESLKRNRESFNAKFALARRAGAGIEIAAFREHLALPVDAIVCQVAEQFAEKIDSTVTALYELSLELFSENLLGPESNETAIADAWRTLLPAVPRLIARDPRRVAASVTNAVHQIAQNAGARPAEWIARMAKLGPRCDNLQTFFDVGRVAAWIAGCPQYRQQALHIVRTLPPNFQGALFDCNDQIPESGMLSAIDMLARNPWLSMPEAFAGPDLKRIRIVRRAGAFRGFTGPFLRPPTVAAAESQLVATDGEGIWILHADVYGCLFLRSKGAKPKPEQLNGPVKFSRKGGLTWDNASANFPELAGWNSAAFDGQTLAVTLPTSHHVFLVARG